MKHKTLEMNLFGNDRDRKEDKATPCFGIDLGTTNSAIAIVKEGNTPEIIPLENGKVTMPSCVMWLGEKDGIDQFVVGHEAYKLRHLPNVVYSVKSLMGTDKTVELTYNGVTKSFTPVQISAEILKGLCAQIAYKYPTVKDVVVTVPAYFNNNKIKDTQEAGKLAGLNLLATFREPTAAALLYTATRKSTADENILVYDLGGGTFDISLVKSKRVDVRPEIDAIYGFEPPQGEESNGITLDVIAKNGNMKLGGDDLDTEMRRIMYHKIESQGYSTKNLSKETQELILLKLEDMKKGGTLKNGPGNYKDTWTLKYTDGTPTVDVELQITVKDFLVATDKIYKRTKYLLDEMLVEGMEIDSIALVGGSTKSDILKGLLKSDYPDIVINDALNPDESVALGAALQAKRLKYGDKNIKVFDILPLSIGVLVNNRVNKVLYKNQSVPFSQTKRYITSEDNQSVIHIDVYQGNSTIPEECVYLGKLVIDNLPPHKKGTLSVFVTLSVDADGVLKCRTKVGNQVKEIELINVVKGEIDKSEENQENKPSRVLDKLTMKKIGRWRKMIEKQSDFTKKEELNRLVNDFENGKINEEYLVEDMQRIREI